MIPTLQAVLDFRAIDPGEGHRKALALCSAVDRHLRRRIGRDPEKAVHVHRLSGDGTRLLRTPAWPVLAVLSLTVNGSPWNALGDMGDDTGQPFSIGPHGWWLEARSPYTWPEGSGNIQLTYLAGYEAWELQDLQVAGAMVVHLLRNEESRIGEGQTSLGDMNIQQVVRNSKEYQFVEDTLRAYSWRP